MRDHWLLIQKTHLEDSDRDLYFSQLKRLVDHAGKDMVYILIYDIFRFLMGQSLEVLVERDFEGAFDLLL